MNPACWRMKGRGLGTLDEEPACGFEEMGSCPARQRARIGSTRRRLSIRKRGMSSACCRVKGRVAGKDPSFTCGGLSVTVGHGLLAPNLFLGGRNVPVCGLRPIALHRNELCRVPSQWPRVRRRQRSRILNCIPSNYR